MKLRTHTSALAFAGSDLIVTHAALAQTEEAYELDSVTVEAFERQYQVPETSTGLGISASLFDTPLSVMTIPMDILNDQQVNNVEDALRNISSVSKFKQGNGGEEKFSIRGFDASQSLYKDGARINNAFNATNIATTETANIERYDILKGPSAILYGQGEPGGVINYVTKKPYFNRNYKSVEAIVGTNDYYRGEFDASGPIGEQGAPFAYRIVSSYEDSAADRDHSFRERWLLAPSFSWQAGENTRVTLQYERITDNYTQDRGQILDGNAVSGYEYSGRLDNSQFFGVPDWNERTESEFDRLGLLVSHDFSRDASISLNASSTRVEKTLYDSSPSFVDFATLQTIDDADNMLIGPRAQGGDGDSDSATVHYKLRVGSDGPITHQLLFGADWERIYNNGWSATVVDSGGERVRAIGYNVNTRQYSGIPAGGLFIGDRRPGVQTNVRQYGFVAQDLISIGDHWRVLVGLRQTEHDNRDADVKTSETSPRLGVVYRANADLSLYASWSEGFVPTTATGLNTATGNGIGGPVLDPESSFQIELGTRWTAFEGGLILSAALFDLRKENIVVSDPASLTLPADQQWSANLGETRTRGFDLQAVGKLSPALRVIAGYAYLDNELVRVDSAFASQAGNALPGIPEHSGNFWGVYEFQEGDLQGLGLGIGAFAQTKMYASTENRAEYGSWAQIDAMAYYKRDNWKLQLNIKNLTDEEYNLAQAGTTSDAFAAIRVGTSLPLSATASFALEF